MAGTVDSSRVQEILDSEEELDEKVEQLARLVRESRYTVFFTGAGVSTSAGIPDYRGPSGCWTRQRVIDLEAKAKADNISVEDLEELDRLKAEQDREVVKAEAKVQKEFAEPAFSHLAIATLLRQGLAHYVITTNLDGLFRKASLVAHRELCCLHGDVFVERCTGCGAEFERNYRVRRTGSHVHDHRAVGSAACKCCGSATPAEWTGTPKGASSKSSQMKMLAINSRPPQTSVTFAKVNKKACEKWPGANLTKVNGTNMSGTDDKTLQKVVATASLPLKFEFSVPRVTGGAPTGGSTTFQDNYLVGSTDKGVGTKDTHINFGEGLDDIDWHEAGEHCKKADLCIVLGTSMSLCHVVHFPFMATKTVIVNLQRTPYDDRSYRGLRLWGTCDDVLCRLLQHLGVKEVITPAPWLPRDAVRVEDLEKAGVPKDQHALARHILEVVQRHNDHLLAGQARSAAAENESAT